MNSLSRNERRSKRKAIPNVILNQERYDEPKKIHRGILYLFFLGFLFVNLYEGILLNNIKEEAPEDAPGSDDPWKQKSWLKFNVAISYVIDASFRILIAFAVIWKSDVWFGPLKQFTFSQWFKICITRFGIQAAEQLTTLSAVLLTSSTASVINQTRIPLIGFLAYVLFCIRLSRNQILYATAILPLAIQFCLISPGETSGDDSIVGIILCAASVLMMSFANVFVENILKTDLKNTTVWNKQFIFAVIDLPIMIILYFIVTYMEKDLFQIEDRVWNPFHENNWSGLSSLWSVTLGINAAVWGFCRLCLLNYADAMWLNLIGVLVMGILWISEFIQDSNEFCKEKLLGLISLAIILVGYEYSTRDAEQCTESDLEDDWNASKEDEFMRSISNDKLIAISA